MATISASILPTPDRIESVLLDQPLFEVINGTEVEQPVMGVYANAIASILHGELYGFRQAIFFGPSRFGGSVPARAWKRLDAATGCRVRFL